MKMMLCQAEQNFKTMSQQVQHFGDPAVCIPKVEVEGMWGAEKKRLIKVSQRILLLKA